MKILYIFPHPDDESFGPAGVIHKQKKEGHEIHLLTLTKGESTKIRFEMGLSAEEMAEIRKQELINVGKLLQLDSLEILDLKDGYLAHMNPLELESIIAERVKKIAPHIIVSYPVHGISGHHDHLTTHFVVKRVFSDLRKQIPNLKRLAFITLPREEHLNDETKGGNYKVNRSQAKYIDAVIELSNENREAFLKALEQYRTFQKVIAESGVKEKVGKEVYFELFEEDFKPPLQSLTEF